MLHVYFMSSFCSFILLVYKEIEHKISVICMFIFARLFLVLDCSVQLMAFFSTGSTRSTCWTFGSLGPLARHNIIYNLFYKWIGFCNLSRFNRRSKSISFTVFLHPMVLEYSTVGSGIWIASRGWGVWLSTGSGASLLQYCFRRQQL